MKLETYIKQIRLHVKEYLPEELQDAKLVIQERIKNNNVLFHEMFLENADSGIFPAMCLEDFYELHQKGMTVEKTLNLIGSTYLSAYNSVKSKQSVDLSYDQVKNNFFLCIINAEKNREILNSLPHKGIEDLAVVYRVMVHIDDGQLGSVLVNNDMLKKWGIDAETLHDQAFQNMEKLFTPEFCSLESKILGTTEGPESEMEEGQVEGDTFVLTNDKNYYGSSYLSCPDILKWASEKVGGDFLILPSSVHECLLLKDSAAIDISELQEIVKLANQTDVDETEYLSDNVYHYNSKSQTLSIAEGSTVQQAMRLMQ